MKAPQWGPLAQLALQASLLGAGEAEVAWEVASCGSILIFGAPNATVHTTVNSTGKQKRHMGHLSHCGRFQTCPVCTPYIMARRLDALREIGDKLSKDEGLRHFMIVLSIRHKRGSEWKSLVKALRKMQAAVRRGHRWRDAVVGFVRLMESTYRHKNGHHPHEHILVSMRVSADFDADEFFSWVHQTCKRNARKARRSCEFTGKWYYEVQPDRLGVALKYLGKAKKMGTSDIPDDSPLNEFSTTTKHQPLWAIPPRAFAEIWRASDRMRWFGVGGVWRTHASAKTDAEIEQERASMGEIIAHIPRSVWTAWKSEQCREVRCLVADPKLTDDDVVAYIASLGGVAGPPPTAPGWGEQIA